MAALVALLIVIVGITSSVGIISNHFNPTTTVTGHVNYTSVTGTTGPVGPLGNIGNPGDINPPIPDYSVDTTESVVFYTTDGYSQTKTCTMYIVAGTRIAIMSVSLPQAPLTIINPLRVSFPTADPFSLSFGLGMTATIGRYSGIKNNGGQLTLTLLPSGFGSYFEFCAIRPGTPSVAPINPNVHFLPGGATLEILFVLPLYTFY
jgi:hypothetical protein